MIAGNSGPSPVHRAGLLAVALGLAIVSVQAQTGRGAAPGGDLVRTVRTALGHGDLAGARRAAQGGPAGAASTELALALVDLFEGRDAAARARLVPLADRAPTGDAALELGLLDVRTGRRDEGRRRLEPIAANRSFATPDDYLRLGRAARGIREFLLSNDAYQRIAQEARPDIQTEWGDMWFQRHRPGDAVISYRQALQIDPRWVPALLGLARALADEAPEESAAALEAVRAQAPDHPDLWRLTAEQQLEAPDIPATLQALDRLAAARPNTIEEAAIRVAIAYKEDGMEAVDAAAARVRAIDSRSALGYRLASEQAARDYRFAEAAVLARKGVEIDPDDAKSNFNLGLYLLRTGDEAAARTSLEISWDLDNSSRVTKNLLDMLDRLDTFEVVGHKEFVFKFAKEEAAVLKAYALPLAEEAYQLYQKRYGFTPNGPILIEVFSVHDDFAVRTLGLPGLVGALGACFGKVVTMDSPRARPPGEFSWQATLWHEMAHVFTLQLSDYRVPRWLTEGISGYEEHLRQAGWGRELTLEFANQLANGRTFGVKNLPQAFKRPESLALAYFEASLVVEHLVELGGDVALRRLLQAYAGRATDEEALSKAFGQSVDALDKSFAAFIAKRYGALSQAMRDPGREVKPDDLAGLEARAAAEPGNYRSQVSYGRALVRAKRLADAVAPLERAAALAPQALGDDSPRGLLAAIAETSGDLVRARQHLTELLKFDHTNVNAARKLAALAAKTNATAEETAALRMIADLDPFDADAHGLLGRRLLAAGSHAPAAIEFEAALALGPANRAEAHTDLAEALIGLGRKAEARSHVLQALKEAPTFARAQDLFLSISGR
jgi:tetratricopeptide (TPR) repeat protein